MKTAMVALGVVMVLGLAKLALSEQVKVTRTQPLNGILVKLDGRDLIVLVKQVRGEPKEITIQTDDSTEFRVDGEAGTLDDLRPDMPVHIMLGIRNVAGPVRMVRATSKSLSGLVIRVEGRNLVIKAQGQGDTEVVVETDGRTQFFLPEPEAQKSSTPATGRLEDIKAGMRVRVTPNSGAARKIIVMANAPAKKTATAKNH